MLPRLTSAAPRISEWPGREPLPRSPECGIKEQREVSGGGAGSSTGTTGDYVRRQVYGGVLRKLQAICVVRA